MFWLAGAALTVIRTITEKYTSIYQIADENSIEGFRKCYEIFPFVCVFAYACSVTSDSFVTSWTVAHRAPLSMGFPRQEYWSGLLFTSPGDLPDAGIEPMSPAL